MEKKQHLPLFGVGPLYGIVISALSAAGICLSHYGYLDSGKAENLRPLFIAAGIILIIAGVIMWCMAVIGCKIDSSIMENKLCTGGVYAVVRNPIYSAILIACTGALMCCANLWLLILPFAFWGFLTVLMKLSEEKWLREMYGEEYEAYCRRVNRCIPWFPKK